MLYVLISVFIHADEVYFTNEYTMGREVPLVVAWVLYVQKATIEFGPSTPPNKRRHCTRVHMPLLIFSGILIGYIILLPPEEVSSAYQTTREYEKFYMDLCTVAPLVWGAGGRNCYHNEKLTPYKIKGIKISELRSIQNKHEQVCNSCSSIASYQGYRVGRNFWYNTNK